MLFVCMDVGVAAAYVCFAMEGVMFVCMGVGVALIPGFANANDISKPIVDGTHPWQLCRSCDFIAQG